MEEPRTQHKARRLYRARVRVNKAPKSYLIWTQNPEDNEGLKHIFQERYGFWPTEICVDDIVDTVSGVTVEEPLATIPTAEECEIFRQHNYDYICRLDGTIVVNPYSKMVVNNETDQRQPNFD